MTTKETLDQWRVEITAELTAAREEHAQCVVANDEAVAAERSSADDHQTLLKHLEVVTNPPPGAARLGLATAIAHRVGLSRQQSDETKRRRGNAHAAMRNAYQRVSDLERAIAQLDAVLGAESTEPEEAA